MAEVLTTFETGNNTTVEIIPLGTGDTAYPKRITITVTDPAIKNATSATISASCATSGQTLKLPSGTTLPFLDPVTGNTVIATLDADVSIALSTGSGPYTGTGSLSLVANHPAIADNSTSSNFIKLGARSTAKGTIKLNDEQLRTFDSTLFNQGQIVGAEGEFSCDGAFSSIDAGLRTVMAQTKGAIDIDGTTSIATAGRYCWVVITTPPPSALYSTGLIMRAIAYCTDLSIDLEAGKITKQSLPFKANGTIYTDEPIVA